MRRSLIVTVSCAVLLLTGCDSVTEDNEATWIDMGLISEIQEINGLTVGNGKVFVGTDTGIWNRSLTGNANWNRSGPDSLHVRSLESVPEEPEIIYAGVNPMEAAGIFPFYVSNDGGQTWQGYGEGLFDEALNAYVSIEDIAIRPGTDGEEVFANLQGTSIAYSNDGGQTWRVVYGALDGFGYPCLLYIKPQEPNVLYQGCEAPLDFAWIKQYDISGSDLTELEEGETIVDVDDISNRRINSFASFDNQDSVLYAGLEGAVIRIGEQDWDWIWRANEDVTSGYTYVKFIWVDPHDSEHIVFGGGDGDASEDTRAGLHETFDGGETVTSMEGPGGLRFDVGGVRSGASLNDGEDFIIATLTSSGARVLMRNH